MSNILSEDPINWKVEYDTMKKAHVELLTLHTQLKQFATKLTVFELAVKEDEMLKQIWDEFIVTLTLKNSNWTKDCKTLMFTPTGYITNDKGIR